MAMSGITVCDTAIDAFTALKDKKLHKYVLYRINDTNDKIIVDHKSEKNAKYEDFIEAIHSRSYPVYAVYDFNYQSTTGGIAKKIYFITWCPESTLVKKKMLIASSKDALKGKLIGFGKELQAADFDDISIATLMGKISDAVPGQTCEYE